MTRLGGFFNCGIIVLTYTTYSINTLQVVYIGELKSDKKLQIYKSNTNLQIRDKKPFVYL